MIAGLVLSTEGRLLLDGVDLSGQRPLLHERIGFVAGGALLFDVHLKLDNWEAALLLFLLAMGACGCIGLLNAELTSAFKRVEFVAGGTTGSGNLIS